MSAPDDVLGFMGWLARMQPGADISLIVVSAPDSRPLWVFHAEGLPEHVGVIHAEDPDPDACGRRARVLIAEKIARHAQERAREAQERADRRALRCHTPTKTRYLTENEASYALLTMSRDFPRGERIPTDFYWCDPAEDGCSGWHLTSHPRGRAPITEPLKPQENTDA